MYPEGMKHVILAIALKIHHRQIVLDEKMAIVLSGKRGVRQIAIAKIDASIVNFKRAVRALSKSSEYTRYLVVANNEAFLLYRARILILNRYTQSLCLSDVNNLCTVCTDQASMRCGRCKQAQLSKRVVERSEIQYCGEPCQRAHWKEHKGTCIPQDQVADGALGGCMARGMCELYLTDMRI